MLASHLSSGHGHGSPLSTSFVGRCVAWLVVAGMLFLTASAWAQTSGRRSPASPTALAPMPNAHRATDTDLGTPLVVATKSAPPFAMQNEDGQWEGLAIDLWKRIAQDLNISYTFKDTTLADMLQGVEAGRYDVGVAAITITSDREQRLDFSQPYYVTGLGIAVPLQQQNAILHTLRQFLSLAFLKAVLSLVALLLIAGTLVWLFERRHNPSQFEDGPSKGIFAGFWWAAVTMTTVGYGDKAPTSTGGRIVGIIWMFTSVVIISGLTAAIASSLTINHLQGPVQGAADLPNVRVGAVDASTSASYLKDNHITTTRYADLAQALQALQAGKVEAVVYDEPILRYEVRTQFHGKLRVLPGIFDQQYYGIALPDESPLREPINQSLLAHINDATWRAEMTQYLGK